MKSTITLLNGDSHYTKNKEGNKLILCDQMTTEKSFFCAFCENLLSSHKKLLKWFFLLSFLSFFFSMEDEKLLADIKRWGKKYFPKIKIYWLILPLECDKNEKMILLLKVNCDALNDSCVYA